MPDTHVTVDGSNETTHADTARSFAVAYHRQLETTWERHPAALIESGEDLHDWIESLSVPKRCLYVVSPVASDCLTLSHFWNRLDRVGARWEKSASHGKHVDTSHNADDKYVVRAMILHGKPDIVKYSRHGAGFSWFSGYQYFNAHEEELAHTIGYEWKIGGPIDTRRETLLRDVCERAEMWAHLFTELADWWRTVQGGPWGMTTGQLALSFFRSRLAEKTVLVHRNERAKRVEAHAIYGGRASTWYFGDVGADKYDYNAHPYLPKLSEYMMENGPIHHFDVRSMYPHLLASERFPVRWICNRDNTSLDYIRNSLNDQCVIATVRLGSNVGEYPLRRNDRVIYPCGEFDTVLCGPELGRAIDDGIVMRVYNSCHYQSGKPFAKMAHELLAMRDVSRNTERHGWDMFIKSLSNAFSGKMAQKGGKWEEYTKYAALQQWGEWPALDADTGKLQRFKAISGLAFVYVEDELSGKPMGAAYAYLTCYGRYVMRLAREGLPARSVVSQDTDGLWLLCESPTIAPSPQLNMGPRAGQFRHVETSPFGRWYSPKHYCTETGWTLAGLHRPIHQSGGVEYTDSYSRNPICWSPDHAPRHVVTVHRNITLKLTAEHGSIGGSGWVDPIQLPLVKAVDVPVPSDVSQLPADSLLSDLERL